MNKMTLENLLKQIKCKKSYLHKSHMTTGNAYRVTLTYKGKSCRFIFNDNYLNASKKKDFLYCLVLDANCYEESRDVCDFVYSFGYADDYATGKKAFESCKKQSERARKLFNAEELELLFSIE